MRKCGSIIPLFWIGKTGKKLKLCKDSRILATYLLTGPSAVMTGLYYIPKLTMQYEAGLTESEVDRALQNLEELGFLKYDPETETVWIPKMLRHQIGQFIGSWEKRHFSLDRLSNGIRHSPFYPELMKLIKGGKGTQTTEKEEDQSHMKAGSAFCTPRGGGGGRGRGRGRGGIKRGNLSTEEEL